MVTYGSTPRSANLILNQSNIINIFLEILSNFFFSENHTDSANEMKIHDIDDEAEFDYDIAEI